jgi:hypothetical protein
MFLRIGTWIIWILLLAFARVVTPIPYEEHILAPSSRVLRLQSVRSVNGSITNPEVLFDGGKGTATFSGDGWVAFDYGKNIGGLVSIEVANCSS